MSFRDELSSLTPTQKQIQVKATSEAQTNAKLDYSGVKDLLRSKAQHNEYTTIAIIQIPIRANQKLQNMSDESVKQEQPCVEEDYFLDKYKKHHV